MGFDVHPPSDGEGQSEEFGELGVDTALLAVSMVKSPSLAHLKLDS